MVEAEFIFHADLNCLLPTRSKNTAIRCRFGADQSVKHLIEALGIPHTEVGRILANGELVASSYLPHDGDCIEVYPALEGCLSEPRFVLDNHLGRLTAYLRMLGFDCLYRNDFQDAELARLSEEEERILISRDRRLLMRKAIAQGYCPRSLEPEQQLREVVRRFDLAPWVRPFHRCLRCNHLLLPVDKQVVIHRLEPLTKRYFEEFRLCPSCDQVYWKGSHYERMNALIAQLARTVNSKGSLK